MRKEVFLTMVLLSAFSHAQASFHNSEADTAGIISGYEPIHGPLIFGYTENWERKLTIKQKLFYFLIKSKIKKQLRYLPGSTAETSKANRNATLSFIFSLCSFLTPLMIIPALIFRNKAKKHQDLLSSPSINRLKVVNVISTIWMAVLIIAILAVVAIMFYGFLKVMQAIGGIH